jgi:putative ABC transport system permease protein
MAIPLSYSLRNLRNRWQVTLMAVGGIALVVAALIILLAMSDGFRLALAATGSAQNAMIVQRGSNSELTSGIYREAANTILADSRIARDAQNQPIASTDVVVIANLKRRETGDPTNVLIRAVPPLAFSVRNNITIIEGKPFTPGLNEIVVGRKIHERIEGLGIGQSIKLLQKQWKIVGIFESAGSGFESEIWGDLDVMGPAFGRTGGYSSLVVRLTDPSQLESLKTDLEKDPKFQVQVVNEQSYYEAQSGGVAGALKGLAYFVAIVMGIGAVFGAMNTMYAIVAARTREIATLRAIGFSRFSVLAAFIIESMLLAGVAGLLGCLLALPFNGLTGATGNANFSELAFAFRVTPNAMFIGIVAALIMGVTGGLLPAARASRLPIAVALREN